ncbi:MAG: bifunctional riboflavin kinase/FAD synthetase [Candidatus Competibacteraceae bacterium]|nr:bifunctional riboflavin kinase/FAD synthetase [Candidatus Competibacteraceae bacterium]
MKIYRHLDKPLSIQRPVVTSGTFDGVHTGHRKIIHRIMELADDINGESVILTFEPHPRLILAPHDTSLRLLTTLDEKLELLEYMGIAHTLIIPFNREFAALSSQQFVQNVLIGTLHTHSLVIGYDHQFGRNREGSFANLKKLSSSLGFHVEEIPAQDVDNVHVSSTKIRQALLDGNVQAAARYLSYPYQLRGTVVDGSKIGRTLGYPTANIQIDNNLKLIPAIGIYAVKVEIEGQLFHGMMSIGRRPTIEDTEKISLEVHIFEMNKNLYGQSLIIYMIERMRDEVKYNNVEELKQQLQFDEQQAKSILNNLT